MCTAATYKTKDFYFGRTLDYEFSYGNEIAITPRNYPFHFRHSDRVLDKHYAIIGMAHISDSYPLYYDAINEKGLGMAGLNFVGNAAYANPVSDKENIVPPLGTQRPQRGRQRGLDRVFFHVKSPFLPPWAA